MCDKSRWPYLIGAKSTSYENTCPEWDFTFWTAFVSCVIKQSDPKLIQNITKDLPL